MTAPPPPDEPAERTPAQLKLLSLYGALQGVEWAVAEVLAAIAGPAPTGNPALREQLMKLQMGLVKYQGICLLNAQPRSSP
jgi:hypothetical protein